MASVFLNYRREDSSGYAGRIYDRLTATFGKQQIFRDVDRIEPGLDFSKVIDDSLASCVAVLVLIGPKWLEARNTEGELRLHEPVDYVRLEIEKALARGIRVIPILVPGMRRIPTEDELPDSIRGLSMLHAFPLTEESWDSELDRLTALLEKLGLKPLPPPPAPKAKRGIVTNILMGLGAMSVLGMILSAIEFGGTPDAVYVPPAQPQQVVPGVDYVTPPTAIKNEPVSRADPGMIAEAQQYLASLGFYSGTVDGIAGPQTAQAVRNFQRSIGLSANGSVNDDLVDALSRQASSVRQSQAAVSSGVSLSGTWWDNFLIRYEMTQRGNQVNATAYSTTNEYIGELQGTLNGNRLTYSYNTIDGSRGSGVGILQPDNQHVNTVATDSSSGNAQSNQLHRGHLPNAGGY